jgi:hypothetical protein
MPDLEDEHHDLVVEYLIHDPIRANADARVKRGIA